MNTAKEGVFIYVRDLTTCSRKYLHYPPQLTGTSFTISRPIVNEYRQRHIGKLVYPVPKIVVSKLHLGELYYGESFWDVSFP